MKLIIVLMVFSLPSFAADRDCIREYYQRVIGENFVDAVKKMVETNGKDANPSQSCSASSVLNSLKFEANIFQKIAKNIHYELKQKSVINADRLMELKFEKPMVSHKDVCETLDKKGISHHSAFTSDFYMKHMKDVDPLNASFENLCPQYFPIMSKALLQKK